MHIQRRKEDLRTLIGSILLLSQPLSVSDLAIVLGDPYNPTRVRLLLTHMQAVISVPDDNNLPIRILHASFEDHVTTESRALPDFYVDRTQQHEWLAFRCFEAMKRCLVKDNICALPPNKEYAKLSGVLFARRKEHIPTALEYACYHWVYHLEKAAPFSESGVLCDGFDIMDSLHTFSTRLLLRWIDTLSVCGNLDKCNPSLICARKTLTVGSPLYNCHKLTPNKRLFSVVELFVRSLL